MRNIKKKLKKKYGVKFMGIFGSFARNEQTEVSDIDILVEFEKPIGLKFFELADYLEEILDMKGDLLTFEAVKQKRRLNVKGDLIYVLPTCS
ncbi:MAG TPA: nucleotidyltransferase [Caldanaerobacter subterraneus]|uniref:Nucleotidyltransferase n=1 Tax=Caldanaerobacter subterraneus TaxID=911092 RepID=A0A357VK59_9THEO|nr:nucleotidyltransferase family protein [Caldanaerobacter subterraneus]HBT48599.1 nucleotidyltransferase [Caldanaerobacter subterraneus]